MKNGSFVDTEELYNEEIEKESLLSGDEEYDLFKKYNSGDIEARDKIVKSNLRLVRKIAKEYSYGNSDYSDIIQEGTIGLIKAAENFDINRGLKFSTYATHYIRGYIMIFLKKNGHPVHVPANVIGKISEINQVKSEFMENFKRYPSSKELAEAAGLSEKRLLEILKIRLMPFSFDKEISTSEREGIFLKDLIPDINVNVEEEVTDKIMIDEITVLISKVLDTLTEKQKYVLEERYGFKGDGAKTLECVSKKLGVSRQCVHQTEVSALDKLRKPKTKRKLIKAAKCGSREYTINR